MPMFDFVCTKCGEKFEELVSCNDSAPACPKCGALQSERQLSAPCPPKSRAFPFKPGPVRPMMGGGMPGGCGMGGGCGSAPSGG